MLLRSIERSNFDPSHSQPRCRSQTSSGLHSTSETLHYGFTKHPLCDKLHGTRVAMQLEYHVTSVPVIATSRGERDCNARLQCSFVELGQGNDTNGSFVVSLILDSSGAESGLSAHYRRAGAVVMGTQSSQDK